MQSKARPNEVKVATVKVIKTTTTVAAKTGKLGKVFQVEPYVRINNTNNNYSKITLDEVCPDDIYQYEEDSVGVGSILDVYTHSNTEYFVKLADNSPKVGKRDRDVTCPYCGSEITTVAAKSGDYQACPNSKCEGGCTTASLRMYHTLFDMASRWPEMCDSKMRVVARTRSVVFHCEEELCVLPCCADRGIRLATANPEEENFFNKELSEFVKDIILRNTLTLKDWLMWFGIPSVGEIAAISICRVVGDFEEFNKIRTLEVDAIAETFGVTAKVAQAIKDSDRVKKMVHVLQGYDINPTSGYFIGLPDATNEFEGLTFAVSGTFSNCACSDYRWRECLLGLIVSNGGKISTSVSKKTDGLFWDCKVDTSKSKKAQELEIPIYSGEDFIFYRTAKGHTNDLLDILEMTKI